MAKTEPTKHWCGTCQQFSNFFRLAAEQIEKLTPEEKAEFRRAVDQQFRIPESDRDFLKSVGINPDA